MDNRILNFNSLASVIHAPLDTYVLAILESYGEKYCNWIMSNYINFKLDINDKYYDTFCPLDLLFKCPYLKYESLEYQDLVKSGRSFSDICKASIDDGKYIYGHINMKYISEYNCMEDDDHNLIVFGYNDDELYVSDFFRSIFSQKSIQSPCIDNAFSCLCNIKEFGLGGYYLNEHILYYFLHIDDSKTEYDDDEYCIEKIKSESINFLNGTDYTTYSQYRYGIDCFKLCISKEVLSRRYMSLMYSVCKLWNKRIDYLFGKKMIPLLKYYELKRISDSCEMQSKINVSLFLKSILSSNPSTIATCDEKVLIGISMTSEILESLIMTVIKYL